MYKGPGRPISLETSFKSFIARTNTRALSLLSHGCSSLMPPTAKFSLLRRSRSSELIVWSSRRRLPRSPINAKPFVSVGFNMRDVPALEAGAGSGTETDDAAAAAAAMATSQSEGASAVQPRWPEKTNEIL